MNKSLTIILLTLSIISSLYPPPVCCVSIKFGQDQSGLFFLSGSSAVTSKTAPFKSLFLSFFYKDTFMLYINGNGGFVGTYLSKSFLINLINLDHNITYFFSILIIVCLFLLSNFLLTPFSKFFSPYFLECNFETMMGALSTQ